MTHIEILVLFSGTDSFQIKVAAFGLLKFLFDDNRSFVQDTSLLEFNPSFGSGHRPKSICVPPVPASITFPFVPLLGHHNSITLHSKDKSLLWEET